MALLLVVTLSCTHHETSVIQQKRSPDGRSTAYLESVEFGGGVDYISRVVIAPSNEPFDKEDSGTWIYKSSDAAQPKSIAWRGNQRLDVILSGSIDPDLAKIETRERNGVIPNLIFIK
ncbi:MAG: hypothetical protein ACJ76N_22115 [Thermoanaerobaculia bacterium]